jgi:hypothetical protein
LNLDGVTNLGDDQHRSQRPDRWDGRQATAFLAGLMKLYQFLLDPCDVGIESLDPSKQDIDRKVPPNNSLHWDWITVRELAK